MFLAYLPALVLAFSGLAVGYILWHRESFHDDELRQKLISQNAEMKQSVTLAKASYAALDERFTRQRGQLNVLQQLCDDWSASREQAELERTQLDVKLSERNKRNDEMVAELKTARDQTIRLEDAVHNLTQNQLDKITQVETTWQQKHAKVEAALLERQTEAQTVTIDRDAQRKKLHQAESRIAELESELKSNATTLENAKKNASGLAQEHVSLETALQHSKELLAKAEGESAAQRSEKESLLEQLAAAQKQSTAWQHQAEELKEETAALQTFRTKSESLVLSLGNANGQLEKVLGQRDSALTSCATLQTSASGLQARIDNQESSIHRLRKCQDDALENLKHELKIRSEIEAKYDHRLSEMRAKLATQKSDFNAQLAQLSESTGKQKADFSAQLAQLNEASGKQKSEFDTEVELLHEVAEQEMLELKKSLNKSEATIAELKTARQHDSVRLQEFKSLQSQFAQRETQLAELTSVVQTSASDYQQQIARLEAHREQLSIDLESAQQQLQSQLKQDSQMIGQLQAERDELREEIERLHQKIAELQQVVVSDERNRQQLAVNAQQMTESADTMAVLQKELERVVESDDNNRQQLAVSAQQMTESTETVSRLEKELERVVESDQNNRQQLAVTAQQMTESTETVSRLEKELERVVESDQNNRQQLAVTAQQKAESTEAVARLQQELQHVAMSDERNRQQLAVNEQQMVESTEKMAGLQKELERRENALKHLQAESHELARLRDDHAASLRRQAELQARLDSMMSDHLSQKSLREQIENHEQTIVDLRSKISDTVQSQNVAQKDATVISFTQAIQQRNESTYDPDYGGRVRRDAARGVVFTEAPESRDDLKRISGIATVLEERLNEFGVYTFKQIMDWQPEEIEEFSRLLTFRERIERDDWQGQARFFYQQKMEANKVA